MSLNEAKCLGQYLAQIFDFIEGQYLGQVKWSKMFGLIFGPNIWLHRGTIFGPSKNFKSFNTLDYCEIIRKKLNKSSPIKNVLTTRRNEFNCELVNSTCTYPFRIPFVSRGSPSVSQLFEVGNAPISTFECYFLSFRDRVTTKLIALAWKPFTIY